jgi:hypothetical protein
MAISTIGVSLVTAKESPASSRFNTALRHVCWNSGETPGGKNLRALAEIPPPQVLDLGKGCRSRRTTRTPSRASEMAADAPAGPAPTTATSKFRGYGRCRPDWQDLWARGRPGAEEGFCFLKYGFIFVDLILLID